MAAGEIDDELAAAASRFYSDEGQRQKKYQDLAPELAPFYEALRKIIEDLYFKDIRFCVFDMIPEANPPRIHVGMTVCCGMKRMKQEIITDELRRDIAMRISGLTKFKDVRWEI